MRTLYASSILTLMVASQTAHHAEINHGTAELPQIETLSQRDHAVELLRRSGYSHLFANNTDMRPYVLAAVEASLPTEFHPFAFEIARSVIEEANHHSLDPFFLLAVIKTESQFNLNAIGRHGEIGLMQILPRTAAWLGPQAGYSGQPDLRNPCVNIRIGAIYFARLRKTFENQPHHYVGAYNMGARNVRRLLASHIEPRIYSVKVLVNYQAFYREIGAGAARSTVVAAK